MSKLTVEFPNLEMVLAGCVAGSPVDWPMVRQELRRALEQRKAALNDMTTFGNQIMTAAAFARLITPGKEVNGQDVLKYCKLLGHLARLVSTSKWYVKVFLDGNESLIECENYEMAIKLHKETGAEIEFRSNSEELKAFINGKEKKSTGESAGDQTQTSQATQLPEGPKIEISR